MKVWQLAVITGDDPELIVRVAASRPTWQPYESIFNKQKSDELCATQNRSVLDSLVPHDFALEVLKQFPRAMYLTPDGRLRQSL